MLGRGFVVLGKIIAISIKDRRQAAREKARRLQEEDERRLKQIQQSRQKVFLALDEIAEREERIAWAMSDMIEAGITKKKIQQDFAMTMAEVNRYLGFLIEDNNEDAGQSNTSETSDSDDERAPLVEENFHEDSHEGSSV